jgi:hypothetical protein
MSLPQDLNAAIKAKLAPRIEQATAMLQLGVKALRYWGLAGEADKIDSELRRCLELFELAPSLPLETKAQKEDVQTRIKAALLSVDEKTYYMMYLYATAICTSPQRTVNNDFRQDVDKAESAYLEQVAKSVNNKLSHAPGFDGAGGGAARK